MTGNQCSYCDKSLLLAKLWE